MVYNQKLEQMEQSTVKKMGKKKPTRLPRELFRSWLRSGTNKHPTLPSLPQPKSETIVGSDVVVSHFV